MSAPPPPSNRQKTPQSPSNASQQQPHSSQPSLHSLRPPPRPSPYTPRYYRPSGASSSASIGWTPRTAASPHAPQRNYRTVPRNGSPRLKSAPSITKPIKPTPITISPSAPNTPSWLKGNYKPQPPSATPLSTVEQWCEHRLSAIKATIEENSTEGGTDDIPALRKVITDLDSKSVPAEIQVLRNLRKDYWKAIDRQKKAMTELRKAERDVLRIDLPAMHIESKISRLRSYAKFIDSGWVDEEALDIAKSHNKSTTKREGAQTEKEESKPLKTEPELKGS